MGQDSVPNRGSPIRGKVSQECDSAANMCLADGHGRTIGSQCSLDVVLPCLALAAWVPLNSPQDVKCTRRRPEINETRLFASFPPYPDIAIVFYIFAWAAMVRHSCASTSH